MINTVTSSLPNKLYKKMKTKHFNSNVDATYKTSSLVKCL